MCVLCCWFSPAFLLEPLCCCPFPLSAFPLSSRSARLEVYLLYPCRPLGRSAQTTRGRPQRRRSIMQQSIAQMSGSRQKQKQKQAVRGSERGLSHSQGDNYCIFFVATNTLSGASSLFFSFFPFFVVASSISQQQVLPCCVRMCVRLPDDGTEGTFFPSRADKTCAAPAPNLRTDRTHGGRLCACSFSLPGPRFIAQRVLEQIKTAEKRSYVHSNGSEGSKKRHASCPFFRVRARRAVCCVCALFAFEPTCAMRFRQPDCLSGLPGSGAHLSPDDMANKQIADRIISGAPSVVPPLQYW